ncbi:MAG: phosphotransferase [Saccharofermentanales bacterium]|jgi:tRNA A-37 threonylcarbamoyl transferase component Bud32
MKFNNLIAERNNKKIYEADGKVYKTFDKSFSKADILNEALNTARVEETGLNIAGILGVQMNETDSVIILKYIEGDNLQDLMDANPDKEDEYLELFVNLQIKVHAQKAPMLNKIKDKMHRKISETDLDATTRYDLHTRLESMPKHDKVCHGDFNPSNIIITKDGTPYILDWSHVTQGNASADVARTYLLFKLKGKDELAEKYLDLFCKKADTAKQYVQLWMPIVAASQSVKGNQEEREFLLSWVEVVDYQ